MSAQSLCAAAAALVCVLCFGVASHAQTPAKFTWGEFPSTADPKVAGKKVAENLLARTVLESRNYGMIYPEVCVGYGAIRFAGEVKDTELLNRLVTRYSGMLNPPGERSPFPHASGTNARGRGQAQGQGRGGPATQPGLAQAPATQPGARRGGGGGGGGRGGRGGTPQGVLLADVTATNIVPEADHVDTSVFGTLPLEIYRQTKDARYLAIGKKSADDQWRNPLPDGLTDQTRWWIDDMFMISAVQSNAYRNTKDPVYLDRVATQMAAYLDKLQKENGLFYHADNSPFYWGRGVGWVAAGLTELLSELPETHPKHARIMDGYKKMMAALLKYQAPSGMWRQLVDNPESWEETSASGMFTFAMATGVKRGWLPAAEYKEPARKAWIALASFLDENGAVRECCVGTDKGFSVQYYMDRARRTGDMHGQAAFSWAAWAMLD